MAKSNVNHKPRKKKKQPGNGQSQPEHLAINIQADDRGQVSLLFNHPVLTLDMDYDKAYALGEKLIEYAKRAEAADKRLYIPPGAKTQ